MRLRTLLLLLVVGVLGARAAAGTDMDKLTSSNLPDFEKTFTGDLDKVDAAFAQLSTAKLPLFDEAGHPSGRRKIKDRRQTVTDLRKTLADFEKSPRGLVVAMTLSDQTEELADEVYDVAQIAYDNDQEELAMQLSSLLGEVNGDAALLQAYALDLAAGKERRLLRLEQDHASAARNGVERRTPR
ncbi:MAG: hypothetical protein ACRD3D_07285 [Terriglobia bacterium]